VGAIGTREFILQDIRDNLQILALRLLFGEEQVNLLRITGRSTLSDEELSKIGIAQINCEGKLQFIHRALAEYYVAHCFVKHLTNGNKTSQQIQNFPLKIIFLERECMVIRVFTDRLLSRSNTSEVLQQYGNRIHEEGEYDVKILHQAAVESNANIMGFLLDSVKAGPHIDTLNELLLKQDDERRTIWHKAALVGNIQVLQRLWKWAKKVLSPQVLKSELLLATVEFPYTDPYDVFSDKRKKHTAFQRQHRSEKQRYI